MFDVRIFLCRSALEVRRSMFDVRVFFRQRCGWWVDVTVDALAGALKEALALSDDERAAMGQRGSEWMRDDFGWEGIARWMLAGYEEG